MLYFRMLKTYKWCFILKIRCNIDMLWITVNKHSLVDLFMIFYVSTTRDK